MKPTGKEHHKLRLQVYLSRNGVCSRRSAMGIVQEGQVMVNGMKVTEPSVLVDPMTDRVSVNGKTVKAKCYQYLLLNKPKGYVTTKAKGHKEKNIYLMLPPAYHHLSPVGRLDKDTEGLLLLTNDGDTAYKLTHPKFNVEKTYYVVIEGRLEMDKRKKIERGVFLDGKRTAPAKVKLIRLKKWQTELNLTIHEGQKRQVRRMFAVIKHKVTYLKRTLQGPLRLGALKPGQFRELSGAEISAIENLNHD